MTSPEPTPDTATLADRLRNLDLHELCEAWSADQIEMTDSSAERYGAAHDAVSTVIDEAIDALAAAKEAHDLTTAALAAAEQQTADADRDPVLAEMLGLSPSLERSELLREVGRLRYNITFERLTCDISADLRRLAEWPSLEDQNIALLREAADKLDGLITSLAKAETARDEANTERWRMKETLDRRTAQFDKEIAEAADDVTRLAAERDAARAEVAELTQQRAALAEEAQRNLNALSEAVEELNQLRSQVEGEPEIVCTAWHYAKMLSPSGPAYTSPAQCILTEPHTVHQDAAGDSAGRWFADEQDDIALAVPVPVGDTSHDEPEVQS